MLFQLIYEIYLNSPVSRNKQSDKINKQYSQVVYPYNIIDMHRSLSNSLQSENETHFDIEFYGCSILVPSLFDEENFNLKMELGNMKLLVQQHTYFVIHVYIFNIVIMLMINIVY